MRRLFFVTMFVLVLGFTTFAHADLVNNGGGLIYDTDLKITWYDYTYEGSAMYGGSNYSTARVWALSLAGPQVGGVEGWRLPNTVDGPYVWSDNGTTSVGYNIITSELGHLFYAELGNKGEHDMNGNVPPSYGLMNVGPFANLLAGAYWSGTIATALQPLGYAYYFGFNDGKQLAAGVVFPHLYALAVHDGNIGPNGPISSVPIPAAIFLFAPSLVGLIGLRRKYLG